MIPRPMNKYESFAVVSMIFKENAKLYKEMSKKTQIPQIVEHFVTSDFSNKTQQPSIGCTHPRIYFNAPRWNAVDQVQRRSVQWEWWWLKCAPAPIDFVWLSWRIHGTAGPDRFSVALKTVRWIKISFGTSGFSRFWCFVIWTHLKEIPSP